MIQTILTLVGISWVSFTLTCFSFVCDYGGSRVQLVCIMTIPPFLKMILPLTNTITRTKSQCFVSARLWTTVFTIIENKLQYCLNNVEYWSKKFFCTQIPPLIVSSLVTRPSSPQQLLPIYFHTRKEPKEETKKVQIKDNKKE